MAFEETPSTHEEEPGYKTRVVVMPGDQIERSYEGAAPTFPLIHERNLNIGSPLPVAVGGGWGRMRAIEAIYDQFNEENDPERRILVLTTGGKEKNGESRAEAAAKQLTTKYGLSSETVKPIGGGGNTMANAEDTADYILGHRSELGDVDKIELVTEDFQMLRAWLMFSKAIHEKATGQKLDISLEDVNKIKLTLEESLKDADSRIGRERVMALLQPYFADCPVSVTPVLVEDMLIAKAEDGKPIFKGGEKYAEKIRDNEWVIKTRALENKGVVDLLEGRYVSRKA